MDITGVYTEQKEKQYLYKNLKNRSPNMPFHKLPGVAPGFNDMYLMDIDISRWFTVISLIVFGWQ